MTNCWGSLDPNSVADGSVSRLLSIADDKVANIGAMPQCSAFPVTMSL
jgi:hypothetical protein